VEALAQTILKNKYTDEWRHRQLEAGKENPIEPFTEDLTAETNDEMEIIRLIIDHLPPLQQQILRMKEIEGYESNEILEITGCTADGLRQNLSRARRKIQQEYLRISKAKRI
jgi:RNA polymerase sigma factor (sigma-70 family)